MALATENLYLGAYAMTNGARLHRVIVSRTDGRTTALFELDCVWSQKLVDEYYAGTATVNLAEYRHHLEALKDELFGALRGENENGRRRREHGMDRSSRKMARR